MTEKTAVKRTRSVTTEAMAERRQSILHYASQVISRSGVEGCSFAELSELSGFSIGMIQHYFRHRERLISATVEYRTEETMREWQRIYANGENALERLHDLLTFAVEGDTPFAEAWGFWLEIYAAAHKNAEIRDSVAEVLSTWRTLFVRALEEAIEERLLNPTADVDELATLFTAVIDGLAIQSLNNIHQSTPKTMIETLHRFAAREFGIDADEFIRNKRSKLVGVRSKGTP
ncbi:TetR/AcrR family transcriptional regulator [Pseudarthrobacter sp. O4]|uniref:TetR/AcrR family transcriptional regulator n=1 Tax=Pseudarthrobacter sp. O4 TaxID=3418417 RepID=UPI003CE72CB2